MPTERSFTIDYEVNFLTFDDKNHIFLYTKKHVYVYNLNFKLLHVITKPKSVNNSHRIDVSNTGEITYVLHRLHHEEYNSKDLHSYNQNGYELIKYHKDTYQVCDYISLLYTIENRYTINKKWYLLYKEFNSMIPIADSNSKVYLDYTKKEIIINSYKDEKICIYDFQFKLLRTLTLRINIKHVNNGKCVTHDFTGIRVYNTITGNLLYYYPNKQQDKNIFTPTDYESYIDNEGNIITLNKSKLVTNIRIIYANIYVDYFCLILAYTDNYLIIKDDKVNLVRNKHGHIYGIKSNISEEKKRFFNITSKLPIEIQMKISFLCNSSELNNLIYIKKHQIESNFTRVIE